MDQLILWTKKMNHFYNRKLKEKARQLRKNSTKAEVRMWCELLKAQKMKGYSFLRQRPILDYIVDFFCKDLKLIIEIDGWTHEDPEVVKKDKRKEKNLRAHGYQVLRFSDFEVMFELEKVKEKLDS